VGISTHLKNNKRENMMSQNFGILTFDEWANTRVGNSECARAFAEVLGIEFFMEGPVAYFDGVEYKSETIVVKIDEVAKFSSEIQEKRREGFGWCMRDFEFRNGILQSSVIGSAGRVLCLPECEAPVFFASGFFYPLDNQTKQD
jgi:hypothetical protein